MTDRPAKGDRALRTLQRWRAALALYFVLVCVVALVVTLVARTSGPANPSLVGVYLVLVAPQAVIPAIFIPGLPDSSDAVKLSAILGITLVELAAVYALAARTLRR